MSAEKQLIRGRTALVLDQFFFGSLAIKLQMIEDSSIPTASTNGVVLKYNPEFVKTLNMDQTKGLWDHEVLHCALGHHTRRNGRDPKTWNIACDYVVNQLMVDSNIELPTKDALLDPKYKGMSADSIYSELWGKKQQEEQDAKEQQKREEEQKQEQQEQDDSSDNGDDSEQSGDDDSDDKEDSDDSDNEDGQGDGDSDEESNSDGDPGGCGGVEDYPGESGTATEAELEEQTQDWQVAATQAAQQAKSRGNLPGALERLIQQLNKPKVNWKEALHRFVDQISRNDYTWRRANQRFVGRGVILPSLYNEELPPIDVVVDTSCSVGDEELKQFASELDDILNIYPTLLRVTYVDTEVRFTEEFTVENRPIVLHAKGGGGTRFSPGIAHAMNQDEAPSCLIYLTDMECSDFGPAPDFPVLWCQTFGERAPEPPFGELIECNF